MGAHDALAEPLWWLPAKNFFWTIGQLDGLDGSLLYLAPPISTGGTAGGVRASGTPY
jgi:hypothetical protein